MALGFIFMAIGIVGFIFSLTRDDSFDARFSKECEDLIDALRAREEQ